MRGLDPFCKAAVELSALGCSSRSIPCESMDCERTVTACLVGVAFCLPFADDLRLSELPTTLSDEPRVAVCAIVVEYRLYRRRPKFCGPFSWARQVCTWLSRDMCLARTVLADVRRCLDLYTAPTRTQVQRPQAQHGSLNSTTTRDSPCGAISRSKSCCVWRWQYSLLFVSGGQGFQTWSAVFERQRVPLTVYSRRH